MSESTCTPELSISSPGSGLLFHVVLHEPEIPNNTGNIGRTCVALNSSLHLIKPLGFDISEHAVRRAGLDYWQHLTLVTHDSWDGYIDSQRPPRLWLVSTKATQTVFEADFQPGDHLVFGKETAGLPSLIRDEFPEHCVRLPMAPHQRSLNLATAVCAVMYEAVRQGLVSGRLCLDQHGYICKSLEPSTRTSRTRKSLNDDSSFLLSK
ncbi:MAG: tRNA (cytidine(34)-2'-O)-methyltransferase [Phycisphaerales bacterium]|nr:tRNA (cytidine(34)-2'-O)-methyltransferase [Phycisphaerales bacterium]